ncbi:MAG TPA: hypothetical protein VG126_10670, partial [Thermoleophilaceae bacterium]|nr:hypothetical protein [Thermoleophilaceae bacterium]
MAFDAQESMRRQLAAELGPRGVRTISIVTDGISEDPADPGLAGETLIDRADTYDDVGRVAGVRRIGGGSHDDRRDAEHQRRVGDRLGQSRPTLSNSPVSGGRTASNSP